MKFLSNIYNSKESNRDTNLPQCTAATEHSLLCFSFLCLGGPCLAVVIRRFYTQALQLSICFQHTAGVNQLKAGLFTLHQIRRILIWHESINSRVVHLQGCRADEEGGKQLSAECQRCLLPAALQQLWLSAFTPLISQHRGC